MLIDTHAHLNFPDLADTQAVLDRAKAAGVERIINIGTNLEDSQLGIEIASRFPNVYTTVGVHPNDPPSPTAPEGEATVENVDWNKFEELARNPKVVAIGECGLDYSRINLTNPFDRKFLFGEKERQKKLFIQQVKIAHRLNLPLSIHIRDAYENMLEIAPTIKTPAVFHCMSGSVDYLDHLLHLNNNFYFSFTGNVTFKNAEAIRQLAKLVPLDKLLIETDCPFLSPEPHRGAINTPANVRIIAEKLAEIKAVSFEELAKRTTENAIRLFKFS